MGTNLEAKYNIINCRLSGRTIALIAGTRGTIFEVEYSRKCSPYNERVEAVQLLKGTEIEIFCCCSSKGIFVSEG